MRNTHSLYYVTLLFFRYAYLKIFEKIGWTHVASLTQDGHKYSKYISQLEDIIQQKKHEGYRFIMNRKFPKDFKDLTLVSSGSFFLARCAAAEL